MGKTKKTLDSGEDVVVLEYTGDSDTFFFFKGKEYRTQDLKVSLPREVADKMLSNSRFKLLEE